MFLLLMKHHIYGFIFHKIRNPCLGNPTGRRVNGSHVWQSQWLCSTINVESKDVGSAWKVKELG
ncbi:unnamed protein product [Acanthoscelides obtectus]|uniref:Uncharacterized protein n=1 Tax=Acanthoscelides obtectus TaxID=200917 RepID=A0A9P0JQK8_ACAOB|nr:unnamed protein product [Acanthoscelides obtectus]CAK1663732.1 hypothetical protein AOBTE_LOCUS23828 [Acanthoscelides obtectus]